MKNLFISIRDCHCLPRIKANPLKLKEARIARGLSMCRLAKLAGISVVFYSDIERGLKGCSTKTKEAILSALKECK